MSGSSRSIFRLSFQVPNRQVQVIGDDVIFLESFRYYLNTVYRFFCTYISCHANYGMMYMLYTKYVIKYVWYDHAKHVDGSS